MTVIYFDGPDRSKKTTLMKAASAVLNVPTWERASYLPHHHATKNLNGYHSPEAVWYALDELKTIKLFKELGATVLVDRHPKLSEIVYRRMQGSASIFEHTDHDAEDEFVILCYNGGADRPVVNEYFKALHELEIDYMMVDTSDGEKALEGIVMWLQATLTR
jgi:hypothetical protein